MIKNIKQLIESAILLFQNYSYRSIQEYQKYKKRNIIGKNDKKLLKKWPINGHYERIFGDIVASRKVLQDSQLQFSNQVIRVGKILNQKVFQRIDGGKETTISIDEVYDLVKLTEQVVIRSSVNLINTEAYRIDFFDEEITLNEKYITEIECKDFLFNMPIGTVIYEKKNSSLEVKRITGFEEPLLHISQLNIYPDTKGISRRLYYAEHMELNKPSIFPYYISEKKVDLEARPVRGAIRAFEIIADKFEDVKYFSAVFRILEDGCELIQIDTGLDLLFDHTDGGIKILNGFVQIPKRQKSFIKTIGHYGFAVIAKKKGFVDYMYKYWLRELFRDTFTFAHRCSVKDLIWAHSKGFYSYRIEQYGLTKDNYKEFLSDREYKRMRPINSKYRDLLTDKLLTFYLLTPKFSDFLPEYYCKIVSNNDGTHFYKINCKGCDSFEQILGLLQEKKKLICKKIVGSHGEGFIKLEYVDEPHIKINDVTCANSDLLSFFSDSKNSYVVTEYVEMHRDIKKIYSDVACTIRIMTINLQDGSNVIKDAYFRFATKNTGLTDNVSKGGIVAKVDLETGEIYKPEQLKDHKFYMCPIHPDTGNPIKGNIPHWELIKTKVTEICAFLSELEYLGFDIVVTDAGFKILEINTHQDLHKYAEYTNEVKKYFNAIRNLRV